MWLAPASQRRSSKHLVSTPARGLGRQSRVFLKRQLEAEGHRCVVLNIGTSRRIPSTEYETVLGAWDYVRKLCVSTEKATPRTFTSMALRKKVCCCHSSPASSAWRSAVGHSSPFMPVSTRCSFRGGRPLLGAGVHAPVQDSESHRLYSEDVKSRIVEHGVPPAKVVPIPPSARNTSNMRAPACPRTWPNSMPRFGRSSSAT